MKSAKKTKGIKRDPSELERERKSLLRTRHQMLLFNDKEMAAIDAYCKSLGLKYRGAALRRIVMERVMEELDNQHPTLF